MNIKPVAYIYNDFKEKFGIPRQGGKAPSAISKIVFLPEYRSEEAFRELEGFSHIWIIFGFSKARFDGSLTVRPPRLGGNRHVGVFASRSPYRPNGIGMSAVKLLEINRDEKEGTVLLVSGADLLDKTPIYDIKPYLPYCDRIGDARGGYTEEYGDHRLSVDFPAELKTGIGETELKAICECLSEDPRPSYQNDSDRIYGMRYGNYNIRFCVDGSKLTVKSVERIGNAGKGE